ncbi:MAG: DUF4271 domain-containing protein [Flavobacteriaceae bacterium]|nr:DUF4271 domain-containing protein [Flavobacteriaceae bacterium]
MQALDRIDYSNNWLTLVFLFALLLLVALKTINQQKLFGYSTAFFRKGFVVKKTEDRESLLTVFNIVLLCFSAIVYAAFFSFITAFFLDETASFTVFIKVLGFVFIYLVLFLILDVGLAKLFEVQNETSYLFSTKIAYLYTISLVLFPVLIITSYSSLSTSVLLFVFVMLFLLSLLLLFVNNKNLILNKLFYFILYLCALEIAPLLIIYKMMV